MFSALRRWRIEAEDRLRYHPRVRGSVSLYKSWREPKAIPADPQDLARSINRLCAVARLARSPARVRAAEQRILERVARLNPAQVDWSEFIPRIEQPVVPRGVILKPYVGPREPGVIYVAFELEWMKLLRHAPLRDFAARYTLVVAPTSNPYNLANFVFPNAYPGPLYSLINHAEDVEILQRVSPHYRVVPLFTSHWVNPERYQPRPRPERDIDILVVGLWGKVKRQHVLFRALRDMAPTLKVVLIGQDEGGRTEATVRREAGYYGIADRIETRNNRPHAEVREAFSRSKVSVLLSLNEGSAVVVPESLFADTPAGLLRNASNGSRDFINEHTGTFLDESDLARQLTDFVARADSFRPRQWAEAHISCFRSSETLNGILKRDALAEGREWTRDLFPLCWQPEPQLVRPQDWNSLQAERAAIKQRFNVDFGPCQAS
jgi:glycosyltransferase involved in cell wall biosynthesis